MTDVQIKQFELSETDALLDFLRLAYPSEPRKSDARFWRWHFLENPYTTMDDVPLWIVKNGARIVGQAATIPVKLKVGADALNSVWILDFIVHADFRGRGLGKRLVSAVGEKYPTILTLGINEQSTAVFRSLRWRALGGIHRYQRMLFPGEAAREISKFDAARKIVNHSFALFRPRRSQLAANAFYETRAVEDFNAEFDDLWERASTQMQCAVARESRYLEWQFQRQPGKRFDVLGLYKNARLIGYAVLFFRKPNASGAPAKAAISDICYDANETDAAIDELLKAALCAALERRAGSLVIDVLDARTEARLKRFGFWRIKRAPQFMAYSAAHADLIYNPKNWFLTRADSDVSIFEESNEIVNGKS
jgi:GNAT superfamily N-acetyltransferase